jgi:hypothetical protein
MDAGSCREAGEEGLMPRFISAPMPPQWTIKVRCGGCRYLYEYNAHDVVKGEDCRNLSRPSIYCGNCKHVNFLDNCVPKKILENATQY